MLLVEGEDICEEVGAEDQVREDAEGLEGAHDQQQEHHCIRHSLDVLDVRAVVLVLV